MVLGRDQDLELLHLRIGNAQLLAAQVDVKKRQRGEHQAVVRDHDARAGEFLPAKLGFPHVLNGDQRRSDAFVEVLGVDGCGRGVGGAQLGLNQRNGEPASNEKSKWLQVRLLVLRSGYWSGDSRDGCGLGIGSRWVRFAKSNVS